MDRFSASPPLTGQAAQEARTLGRDDPSINWKGIVDAFAVKFTVVDEQTQLRAKVTALRPTQFKTLNKFLARFKHSVSQGAVFTATASRSIGTGHGRNIGGAPFDSASHFTQVLKPCNIFIGLADSRRIAVAGTTVILIQIKSARAIELQVLVFEGLLYPIL